MTTRKYQVTHPKMDESTNEPMEIENWSNSDSDDDMKLEKPPLNNPIYQVTHQPAMVRNPHTGRYISTTSRAYNELTRGVYRTPTERRNNTEITEPHKEPSSKMEDLWDKHGF